MVDAGAAALEEAGDGGVVAGRLEELDRALAAGDERHPDALGRHLLDRLDLEPQGLVELPRLVDRGDRDADVVDAVDHRLSTPRSRLRAITIRWISLVPSPMVQILASR